MKKPNINYTLQNDICTGCGICEAVCPFGAIKIVVKSGRFVPQIDIRNCNNSKGCHRCYDVCPGIGIDLISKAKVVFPAASAIDTPVLEDKYIGRYYRCFTGYSNDHDIRYHSASGGMITQFLIWLLENNKIDGVVVTKFDKESPLKVKSFIASTRDEILSAKSSKYAPVSLHEAISDLKKASKGRYVVVGLPCHIESMRKLMEIDKDIREKIVGLFGIYCSGSRTFGMTEYLMQSRKICINDINYLAYRDNGCLGGMVVKGDKIDFYEDYQRYCHPLRTMFHPRRCLLCADHFAELADVSFGDIHVDHFKEDKIGINSIVVRNPVWQNFLLEAVKDGTLSLCALEPSILLKSQGMAKVKKGRYIGYCLFLRKLGKKVPDYGTTYGVRLSPLVIAAYIKNSIDRFIGNHKTLWPLISFLRSKVNIH